MASQGTNESWQVNSTLPLNNRFKITSLINYNKIKNPCIGEIFYAEDTGKYYKIVKTELNEDEKVVIANDGYEEILCDMIGATSSEDGKAGLVPAPSAGDEDKYLRADGTWSSSTGPKGDTGEQGPQGERGEDGTSVEITNITSTDEPGGANTVTFTGGNTLTVLNG